VARELVEWQSASFCEAKLGSLIYAPGLEALADRSVARTVSVSECRKSAWMLGARKSFNNTYKFIVNYFNNNGK